MFFIIIDHPNIIDKSHFYAKLLFIRKKKNHNMYIVYIDDKSPQKNTFDGGGKRMSSDLSMDCRTST